MFKKIIKISVLLVILSYLIFCSLVYFVPQIFFYNPSFSSSRLDIAIRNNFPAQRVEYLSDDAIRLYAWYIPAKANKKTIIFMHGNSYNIEKFYHKLAPFVDAGYGVMLPEYRGFGGINGTITQSNLEKDAKAAINWLNNQGLSNSQMVLYGMSLGAHMAVSTAYDLGQESNFAGLVLEVPFDSLLEVVKERIWFPLPLDLIIKDKYDNIEKISQLRIPLLIMGASDDKVVPVNRAKQLYLVANSPKSIKIYQGAEHSDLYKYHNYKDIIKWLENNEKIRP